MKVLLGVVLFSFLFSCCECGNERTKRKYVLENGTTRHIKIDFYDLGRFSGSRAKTGQGIIIEEIADDGGMGKSLSPMYLGYSDSIIVYFDNDKRQIYYLNNGLQSQPIVASRHILNEGAYIIKSNELYRFVFTEQDYNNAEMY